MGDVHCHVIQWETYMVTCQLNECGDLVLVEIPHNDAVDLEFSQSLNNLSVAVAASFLVFRAACGRGKSFHVFFSHLRHPPMAHLGVYKFLGVEYRPQDVVKSFPTRNGFELFRHQGIKTDVHVRKAGGDQRCQISA